MLMKTHFVSALLSAIATSLMLVSGAPAQQLGGNVPAGNVLYTVGTTFSSGGQDHAYLLWSPTDDDLLRLRAYSIWSKPGGANSPAEYQPMSWIKVQTDPATIELTLRRAERLGQELSKLETAIDGLFEDIRPAVGVSRADKLSVILQGALNDPEMFHNLLILARLHPAVGLCMGAAYAGPINGLRTFEVRMAGPNDGPGAPDAARRVVGRVTLNPVAYEALPAPGPAVSVPFGGWVGDMWIMDARASLNARMRWSTPDPLRQQTLLQFGYQVYRIKPPFYQAQIAGTTLQPGDLAGYAQAFPNEVKRVNRSPVLIDRMFTLSEATDRVTDPETAFLVDSNGLGEPGAVPFEDGQSFFYMVTAVDILGRDGHASAAQQITIYRTTPPAQASQVSVEDLVTHPAPTTMRQEFRVKFQASPPVPGVSILKYEVFRWQNVEDITKPDTGTPPVLVATVTAIAGREWYEAKDATLGVPVPAGQLGKPHWFTVRAVAVSALAASPQGAPKSPHSAPASCILRDRSSPTPPVNLTADVVIVEGRISMSVASPPYVVEDLPAPDYGYLNCRIDLTRDSPAIDGADCYCRINNTSPAGVTDPTPLGPAPRNATYLGSIRFADVSPNPLSSDLRIKLPTQSGDHSVTLHLRARDRHGNLTGFVSRTVSVDDATYGKRHLIPATVSHSYAQTVAGTGPTLLRHVSRRADNGQINLPFFEILNLPGDGTWKIQRRIDQGEMELEAEGKGQLGGYLNAKALATNAGEVSYSLQLTSANGVAGPLREIGRFRMSAIEPPPQPMLLPVEALPDEHATLSWACAPHGVERFHIGVAGVGHPAPDSISGQLSTAFETRSEEVTLEGKTTALDFRMYDTGAVGGSSPEHAVTLDLEDGVTYHFIVQAISSTGERGKISNRVSFAWIGTTDPGPNAPWPARAPAQINSNFGNPKASMEGIIIGSLPKNTTVTYVGNTWRLRPPAGQNPVDLMTRLYRESSGEMDGSRRDRLLLPCVVYRYQLPNAVFPKVSGDVVQVSPLIVGIAARAEKIGGVDYTVVYDPYFRFYTNPNGIYLIPPQPLIDKSTYRYLMVLLREDGEIDSVVPTTTFTVDVNPN